MISQGSGLYRTSTEIHLLDNTRAAEAEHKKVNPQNNNLLAKCYKTFQVIWRLSVFPITWQFHKHPHEAVCKGQNTISTCNGGTAARSSTLCLTSSGAVFAWSYIDFTHVAKHPVCLCLLPEFPGHSGHLWRTKDMSCLEPGKISAWKMANILLYVKKLPLLDRKHLTGIKYTIRNITLKS